MSLSPPQALHSVSASSKKFREWASWSYALGAGQKATPDLVFDPAAPAESSALAFGLPAQAGGDLFSLFCMLAAVKVLIMVTKKNCSYGGPWLVFLVVIPFVIYC